MASKQIKRMRATENKKASTKIARTLGIKKAKN